VDSELFWCCLAVGERRFKGLEQVLAYLKKKEELQGDFYSPTIISDIEVLYQSVIDAETDFWMWLTELGGHFEQCKQYLDVYETMTRIWRVVNSIKKSVNRRLWMGQMSLSANNNSFDRWS